MREDKEGSFSFRCGRKTPQSYSRKNMQSSKDWNLIHIVPLVGFEPGSHRWEAIPLHQNDGLNMFCFISFVTDWCTKLACAKGMSFGTRYYRGNSSWLQSQPIQDVRIIHTNPAAAQGGFWLDEINAQPDQCSQWNSYQPRFVFNLKMGLVQNIIIKGSGHYW